MASLLGDSITSALQQSNKSDLKKLIPKLLDEIDYYKAKTKRSIDAKYVDFVHQLPETESYVDECEDLIAECQLALAEEDGVGTRESLSMANIELLQYKNEVRKIFEEMQVLRKVLRVDVLLEEIERCTANNDILGVMEFVFELEGIINEKQDMIFRNLACFENIDERFRIEKALMLDNLKGKFNQLVQTNEKQFQTNKLVSLKLTKDMEELNEVLTALVTTNFNPQWICNFLLENILVPIITRPVSLDYNENSSEFVELKLSFSVKERSSDDLKPKYQVVFRNLRTAFETLRQMNVLVGNTEKYVFDLFRQYMKEKFLRTLIDECLMDAVPDTMDDMKETTLVEDVMELHKYLVEIHFYEAEEVELVRFGEKVDALFRNKFSTNILNTAVAIMRKDLSDMVLMAPGSGDEAMSAQDVDETNPTIFPKCMVSKNTVELINLMSKIIREIELLATNSATAMTAAGDAEPTRIQLLSIISVIVDRYITEVPSYHKKLLTRIPHLTALFHNNCLYLSYWVGKRESVLNMSTDSQLLIDLKRLGLEYLTEQVSMQRSQFLEIMREFDLNDSLTELSPAVYRCVRQCLRQMDLLKNVWQSILPDATYHNHMGALLNDFIVEVIRKIMTLEDIATAIANGLVDVIGLIMERAPSIFTNPLRVTNIVKSWSKMTQLKMILGASLLEITEHWGEGTGPLTLNFRADEIKFLIRALFQNTKRRADALNTIVN